MIATSTAPTFQAICDTCERPLGPRRVRRQVAEYDERQHECGVHRQAWDSSGGFRGILGGWNRYCVCGEHWVVDDPDVAFVCPKDSPQAVEAGRDARLKPSGSGNAS